MRTLFSIRYESGRVEVNLTRLKAYVEHVTANSIGAKSTDEAGKRQEVSEATALFVRTVDAIYRTIGSLTLNYDPSEVDSLLL